MPSPAAPAIRFGAIELGVAPTVSLRIARYSSGRVYAALYLDRSHQAIVAAAAALDRCYVDGPSLADPACAHILSVDGTTFDLGSESAARQVTEFLRSLAP